MSDRGSTCARTMLPSIVPVLLLGLIMTTALYAGGNRPIAWSLMATGTGGLMLAWSFARAGCKTAAPVGLMQLAPVALPFAVSLVWILLQISPILPSGVGHPVWLWAAVALERPLASTISVSPDATVTALMRLLTYGAIFWLSAQYASRDDGTRSLLAAVVVAGIGLTFYAFILDGLGLDGLGVEAEVTNTGATDYGTLRLGGPFPNPNHFATLLGLLILTALTLLLAPTTEYRIDILTRQGLGQALTLVLTRRWLYAAAIPLFALALWRTGSRGGLLAYASAFACFPLLLAYAKVLRWREALLLVIILGGVGFGLTGMIGLGSFTRDDRFLVGLQERRHAYSLALRAIADAPLTGCGYGTFADIFTMYRDAELPQPRVKLENDYLELAVELGVPGAITFAAIPGGMAWLAWRGLRRRRRNRHFLCLGLSLLVMVGLHAMVDFSLQIPAIAGLFSLVMGASCAQSEGSSGSSSGARTCLCLPPTDEYLQDKISHGQS